MSTTPLRHALMGVGATIFPAHQRGLALETAELVAVSDIDENARERALRLEVPFYTDNLKMLEEVKPDVAVVIVPHNDHAELAIAALEAGCHVLIEKPIALHVKEADAIAAAAQKANRLVAVNFQHRFRPEVIAARQLIENGDLGHIQNIDMKDIWPRSKAYYDSGGWRATWVGEGGGVLMNQAPHNLDLIVHLLGLPKRVMAITRTILHSIEVEDTIQAVLEWDSGTIGSMYISTAGSGHPGRLEVLGTGGMLNIGSGSLDFQKFPQDLREYFTTTDQRFGGPRGEAQEVALDMSNGGDHKDVYQNFHAAILNGESVRATAEEGVKSLELANAMIFSSYLGEPVELPIDRAKYADLLSDLQTGHTKMP